MCVEGLTVCRFSFFFCDAAVQSSVLETKQSGQKTAGLKMTCPKMIQPPLCFHTLGYSQLFQTGLHMTQKIGACMGNSSGFTSHLSQQDFEIQEVYVYFSLFLHGYIESL